MSRKAKRPPKDRHYDVEMIHDFLEHLTWEVRISHFEAVHPETVNPELVEQLSRYVKKRRTAALLFSTSLAEQPDPEKLAHLLAIQRKVRARQVRCLETLGILFKEALSVASKPDVMTIIKYPDVDKAIEIISEMYKDYLDDDDGK
jgi:hypothetical protein